MTYNFTIDKKRLNLYFDIYQYKINLDIADAHKFKYTSYQNFDERLQDLIARQITYSDVKHHYPDIKRFLYWRENIRSDDCKIAVLYNKVTVYTNSTNLIDTLLTTVDIGSDRVHLLKAEVMRGFERDVVYLVEPQHKFRLFFRDTELTVPELDQIKKFLYEQDITLGRALKKCFRSNPNWRGKYHLWNCTIDFDREELITYMSLKFDNLIGKVSRIEKRDKYI